MENGWNSVFVILCLVHQSQPVRVNEAKTRRPSTAVADKRIVHDNGHTERWLTREMQMESQTAAMERAEG